jgi:hypothetical protein
MQIKMKLWDMTRNSEAKRKKWTSSAGVEKREQNESFSKGMTSTGEDVPQ